MRRETVVVVGAGMIGHRFCTRLRELDRNDRYRIVWFGEEPHAPYDRVNLVQYYEHDSAEPLLLAPPGTYTAQSIDLRIKERVASIELGAQQVTTELGDRFPYHHLVLATGSAPFMPPMPGIKKTGVFAYRTIDDLAAIRAYAAGKRSVAVIGGGLLGLEAARAMQALGLETHVVELAPRLMPRQLDENGAKLVLRAITALGVQVHLGVAPSEILGDGRCTGLRFADQREIAVDMLVVSAGIRPRDELASKAGIILGDRGGVIVDDQMGTSDPQVYAIGECALHRGVLYGLVAPGYEMADVLAKRLMGQDASFVGGDQSAKLKLMGVEVAMFGDPFTQREPTKEIALHDLVNGVYKKLIVSDDAKRLLGGILVGDASDYGALLSLVRSKKPLTVSPEELIVGKRGGESAIQIDDSAQVCSCNNVTRGELCASIRDGKCSIAELKQCTRAGTGCGGCVPLMTDILTAELSAQGKAPSRHICEHFAFSRQELFEIVAVRGYRSFAEIVEKVGRGFGCEQCKPVVASILASVHNDLILNHETVQDTNDRFLANVQRGGVYSVVPRIPGGEITPDKLIKLGEVAKKYGLYTKITGGQRIDMFGAQLNQLPDIWEELVDAGFESGHAYGKAVRTVKSCVGSSWCRYGVQDSVAFAIRVEERYKGIRAPHKLKSAVSGCVRECAEAQSKDFGIIATEKGWNLYVCGNGGAKPRHADLLAADLDSETCIRFIDRFLMFYIRTADRLTRTSVWLEKMEGGIDHLRDVIVKDSLGLCAELEREMNKLVRSYKCEWAEAVRDPERRARFQHFANSPEPDTTVRFIEERAQRRPVDWPKLQRAGQRKLRLPTVHRRWVPLVDAHAVPRDGGIAVKYGKVQLAVFNFASRGEWYATQNMCPHRQDMVLSRGIIGDHQGTPKVACPLHKKTFALDTGTCLSGDENSIGTFAVQVSGGIVYVELPPPEMLEAQLCKADRDCDATAAE